MSLLTTPTVMRWITQRLISDTTLVNLIGGASAARIVDDEAQKGIVFPYVLISTPDPGRPTYFVGAQPAVVDGIYVIRGVHQALTYGAPLETLAQRILTLFHKANDPAYSVVSCVFDATFRLTESRDQTQYRHLGGRFLITSTV